MNEKRGFLWRYAALGALFVVACLIYTARLIRFQIAGQDYYTMTSASAYSYRYETIYAQRGEIYDRNGKPLVVNEYTYNIDLDAGSMPQEQDNTNDAILSVLTDAEAMGESERFSLPASPYTLTASSDNAKLFAEYVPSFLETSRGTKLKRLLAELNCEEDASAQDTAEVLLIRYGLMTKGTKTAPAALTRPADEAALLLTIRLDMELNDFSARTPYTILTDVSFE